MSKHNVIDSALGVHADALKLRARRAELLSVNIANADTPGFQARDMDFAAALRAAQDGGTLRRRHHLHLPAGNADASHPLYRIPQQPSADGNTVDAQQEKSAFAENSVAYQIELEFLGSRFRGLLSAIRGE